MHALIVDDSRAIRTIVGRLVRELGFEVVETRRFSGWGRPILLQRYERRSQS